jgi:hypothetical protein
MVGHAVALSGAMDSIGRVIGGTEDSGTSYAVARRPLEAFARVCDGRSGVAIDSLDVGSELVVRTGASDYRLLVLDPRRQRVLVEGGRFLPEPVEGVLQGASGVGSLVKNGWISVGLRLELVVDRRRIVTSPVRSIRISRRQG